MFAARIGVGVGESTLTPAAYSMLADRFSGKRLVHALAGYNSAIYLGPAIATLFGGVLLGRLVAVDTVFGHFVPWQIVFILVGLPGIVITLLVATMGEPPRRGDLTAQLPGFGAVLAHMRNHARAYVLLIFGLCCQSVMWNGTLAWIPTFFIRDFGWTPGEVGLRYAPVIAAAGTCGCLSGGWLAGRLRDWGRSDSNVMIGVIAALSALPFAVAAPLVADARLSLALFGCFLFAGAMPYGAAAAAFQEITPNRMRGQVSAIYLFWLNLAGIGLGSMLVALVTEHAFGDDLFVGRAIALVAGTSAILSAVVLGTCMKPYRQAMAAQP
jgi:MFS family permease